MNRSKLVLATTRLILRPMPETDIDALCLIFTDPKVMASSGGELFNRTQMEHWVHRNLDHQTECGYGLSSVILRERSAEGGLRS